DNIDAKQPLIEHNAKQKMIPASTQKLIVALAAMLSLGPDYRFSTTLEITDKPVNGVLNGDVVIHFSGDPSFTKQKLAALIEQLAAQGVSTINGNVIIDTSVFGGHSKAIGWSWNNISACYNAPVSAVVIDSNCFYGYLTPAKEIGQKASISLKEPYPVHVASEVMTIPNISDNKYCELDIITKENNRYILTGCLKQSKNKTRLAFAIQDSVVYANQLITAMLRDKHIRL